ncbi:RING finger protein 212B-like [Temnothorax curvispinosus]|uniref:RING finger protein 212B-like n=1 Tax=Temnothorax curvispinosus TaxID=300111 RepID=A0A6J1QTP7_9HYME|nr:RING finger protein 212B-like [Temnothorax curvispinosus]
MSEMIELNWMICNKCFAPFYRGKRPYHVTQCGHISCHNCLQQVEQQCPQCQHGTMTLALEEPLMPRLIPYFQPLAETLEMLLKINTFRDNQMKILSQRFIELDKKYELLKTRYWLIQRNFKALTEKYMSVKNDKENLEKKLMVYQMRRVTPRSAYRGMETPSDSGISSVPISQSDRSRYSMESLNRPKSKTPMGSIIDLNRMDLNRNEYRSVDGFRIPFNRKPARSMDTQNMLS